MIGMRPQQRTKNRGTKQVTEATLHGELAKQVEEKKLQKLEAQLKEARAVHVIFQLIWSRTKIININ